MGQSLPPPATLDLVGSYARRNGAAVDLLLARSDLPSSTGPLVVHLARGSHSVTGTASVRASGDGSDVVAKVPAKRLSDGTWSIRLGVDGDDETVPVSARLLVQGDRPVVLLWGEKAGKTMLPTARRGRSGTVTRRVVVGGSKALDAGLKVLPEPTAAKVRSTVRKVARTVLH
jgi:hypothetical protein